MVPVPNKSHKVAKNTEKPKPSLVPVPKFPQQSQNTFIGSHEELRPCPSAKATSCLGGFSNPWKSNHLFFWWVGGRTTIFLSKGLSSPNGGWLPGYLHIITKIHQILPNVGKYTSAIEWTWEMNFSVGKLLLEEIFWGPFLVEGRFCLFSTHHAAKVGFFLSNYLKIWRVSIVWSSLKYAFE